MNRDDLDHEEERERERQRGLEDSDRWNDVDRFSESDAIGDDPRDDE